MEQKIGKLSHKRDGNCYHKNTVCQFLEWRLDSLFIIHDYCQLFMCKINRHVTDHCRETLEDQG